MNNRKTIKISALGVAGISLMALAGCAGSAGPADGGGATTLTFWHNGVQEPLLSIWQGAADAYHTENPEITIKVVPIKNEDFLTKVPLGLSSSSPPDIYFNQGGGLLATQMMSGQVADITKYTADWIGDVGPAAENWAVDETQYGVPYAMHVVGFWYRLDLFEQAGITEPPKTMEQLDEAVVKLKKAGISPIAVGGKDRWPDSYYYSNFALRQCDPDTLKSAMANADLSDPCFTKAGQNTIDFLATKPFQKGFNGTPYSEGATSSAGLVANGSAAMELQGTWSDATMTGLQGDPEFAAKIGWFPFPSVAGGKGDPSATLGGGDGFSCTLKHAKECADFLKFLSEDEIQSRLVESGAATIPVTKAAAAALTDPVVRSIYEFNTSAAYVQTYFDLALPTSAGTALNDAIANLFAGQGDAASVPNAVKAAQ